MKKSALSYALVFGLSLSSCQMEKSPLEAAHPRPAMTHKMTGPKSQVSQNKDHSTTAANQQKNQKGEVSQKEAASEAKQQAVKRASFFGEIWIRPGKRFWPGEGETLYMKEDLSEDGDPKAMSYSALKSMYRGVFPKKRSSDSTVYKLIWVPYGKSAEKQSATVPPLEKADPIP